PEYVLDRSPEAGLVNPDNLHVLVHHLKCAAFEIPFEVRERFGTEDTPGVLAYLDEQGVLHESGGKYHWSDQAFPAETTSLRTARSSYPRSPRSTRSSRCTRTRTSAGARSISPSRSFKRRRFGARCPKGPSLDGRRSASRSRSPASGICCTVLRRCC